MSKVVQAKSVGKYVREIAPRDFAEICSVINSRSLHRVGTFVEQCDPDMYEHVVKMIGEQNG